MFVELANIADKAIGSASKTEPYKTIQLAFQFIASRQWRNEKYKNKNKTKKCFKTLAFKTQIVLYLSHQFQSQICIT